MKFGQAMSIFEAALPEELAAPYREQLTRLQDSAPPMPTMTVRQILARELGGLEGASWSSWTRCRQPPPPSARCTGPIGRRPRGGGQGAVPRRRRGADLRPAPARPRRARHRSPGPGPGRQAADRRAPAAHRRGARLPPRGRGAARLRRRVPRRPRHPRPRAWSPPPAPCWSPSDGEPRLPRARDPSRTQEERDHYGSPSCGSCSRLRDAPACARRPTPGELPTAAPQGRQPGPARRARLRRRRATAQRPAATLDGYPDPDRDHRGLPAMVAVLREEGCIRERIRITPTPSCGLRRPVHQPARVAEFTFSRAWMQEQFRRVNDPSGTPTP